MTVVDFWLVQVCFHRFVFPNNFGVNHTEAYNDAWNIRIHPSVTYYSANGSAVYTTTANITYGRIPPNMQLYEEFKVPNGVSYACACMYELCESHTVWAWVNRALCELSMFELCAALTLVLNALFIVHDNSHHSMPCRHISKLKKNIYTVHKKSECKNVQ